MWTPRRILLLLATLFGFGLAYAAYARFLGRIDGLPKLPSAYLEYDPDKALPEPPAAVSPTLVKLREAFGPNCAEMGAAYPTRLEMRESGVVFAAGMPQIGTEPTRFVRMSPLSIAIFAKPKPAHEMQPGEVTEISTLHSDEGILEFDRPIASDRDLLGGKAKVIGVELRSNPDPHSTDPRNSRIIITNNQRNPDVGRSLVMKTAGPVFYRTADHPDSNNPSLPHIWTGAGVEIVNRDNLPRPLRGFALPAVTLASDDALVAATVAEMALGLHTAPPTVTADGMKIFMKRTDPAQAKGQRDNGYSGIRELIFNENVLFSLWVDGGGGFPGGDSKTPTPAPKPSSMAAAALVGGLHDGRAVSETLRTRALLRIRTLGSFVYDLAANAATFAVAPQANPLLPNNVEVTRFTPLAGKDHLICQKLEIEFAAPVAGGRDRAAAPSQRFKTLKATGTHVMIAAAGEQLQAQGSALVYSSDPAKRSTTTVLRGAPLSAVRGRSVLIAGTAAAPSELRMVSIDPLPGSKDEKFTDTTIHGPGRIDMYDETTNKPTLTATWKQSLTQARETLGGVPCDRLTFTGDGEFAEANGQFRLKSDILKLWLKAGPQAANGKPAPHKLQGLGRVSGASDDSIIENTDQLEVLFVDAPPAATPMAAIPAAPPGPAPLLDPAPRTQAPTKQPPVRLAARKIDVWLMRVALPQSESKYDLHEARLDDRVVVTQPPSDPKKSPIGLDIRGGGLLLKKRGTGHLMTVTGTPTETARVRFENVTICGPSVSIDQPANSVAVAGGGWLKMPASSSLAGAAVAERAEITIHWQTRMKFLGERRWAEFVGQVQAVQAIADGVVAAGPTTTRSSIAGHELNVTFDKPIYFNQMNKPKGAQPEGDAKIETVVCTPASGDEDAATRTVLYLEETLDRVTKKPVKAQQIEAKLLEARVKDDRSLVFATGPGVSRLLQRGNKESGPGPRPPNAPQQTEMKLTVVRFNGRLDLEDRKGVFQKAVFKEAIRVAYVPSETLHLTLDEFTAPPPRSMLLKCNDKFTVSTHKMPNAEDVKSMEAVDGAEIKTDDYIGVGHTITFDGEKIVLRGYRDGQATLYRRDKGLQDRDYKSGNPLTYNTKTGQVFGAQSSGGSFTK